MRQVFRRSAAVVGVVAVVVVLALSLTTSPTRALQVEDDDDMDHGATHARRVTHDTTDYAEHRRQHERRQAADDAAGADDDADAVADDDDEFVDDYAPAASADELAASDDDALDDSSDDVVDDGIDWENVHLLRIRQLKDFLAARGVDCGGGCVEKQHYVDAVRAARHTPLKKSERPASGQRRASPSGRASSIENMSQEELMAWFRAEEARKKKDETHIFEQLRAQGINLEHLNVDELLSKQKKPEL